MYSSDLEVVVGNDNEIQTSHNYCPSHLYMFGRSNKSSGKFNICYFYGGGNRLESMNDNYSPNSPSTGEHNVLVGSGNDAYGNGRVMNRTQVFGINNRIAVYSREYKIDTNIDMCAIVGYQNSIDFYNYNSSNLSSQYHYLFGCNNTLSISKKTKSDVYAIVEVGYYNQASNPKGYIMSFGAYNNVYDNDSENTPYYCTLIGLVNRIYGDTQYSAAVGYSNTITDSYGADTFGYYNQLTKSRYSNCIGHQNTISSSESGYDYNTELGYSNYINDSKIAYAFGYSNNIRKSNTVFSYGKYNYIENSENLNSIGIENNIYNSNYSICVGNYDYINKDKNAVISIDNSILFGNNLLCNFSNQLIVGNYNDNKETNIFEYGNGTSSERSNLIEIDVNHNMRLDGDYYNKNGVSLDSLNLDITETNDNLNSLTATVSKINCGISNSNNTQVKSYKNLIKQLNGEILYEGIADGETLVITSEDTNKDEIIDSLSLQYQNNIDNSLYNLGYIIIPNVSYHTVDTYMGTLSTNDNSVYEDKLDITDMYNFLQSNIENLNVIIYKIAKTPTLQEFLELKEIVNQLQKINGDVA